MDHTESANEKTADKASFGKNSRQLWIMSKAFFASEHRPQALRLPFLLLAFVLSVAGIQVFMSYMAKDFMTALSKKDATVYWRLLWWYPGLLALAVPLNAYYRWTEERLDLLWRKWMAQHLIKTCFPSGSNRVWPLPGSFCETPHLRFSTRRPARWMKTIRSPYINCLRRPAPVSSASDTVAR